MARRASTGEVPRSTTLTIRVTEAERALVEQRAAAAGMTPSRYGAQQIMHGRVVVQQRAGLDPAHLAELKRIGNNLNQMAAAMNAGRDVPPPAMLGVMDALREIITTDLTARRVEHDSRNAPDGPEAEPARLVVPWRRAVSVP